MKLATYELPDGRQAIGVVDVESQRILNLQLSYQKIYGKGCSFFLDMLALIDGAEEALDIARDILAKGDEWTTLSKVKLLAPVPVPRQIRDFNNAEDHWRDAFAGMEILSAKLAGNSPPARDSIKIAIPEVNYTQPIFYISNRFNVIGPEAEIAWPGYSKWLDYEAEFGFFVSRKGKDISVSEASSYIFGYCIFNDVSARDKQIREMQGKMGPTKGKSFDTGNVMGPWIVTRDEIPDSRSLEVTIRVNGETWGKTSTNTMVHSFEYMLSYVSESETIHPGEFFGSGTIAGGCSLECDRWMKDGDIIEIEFEKIGTLRNKISRKTA